MIIEHKGYKLKLVKGNYENGNLALALKTIEGEPYARITVNLEKLFDDDLAFIDVNNFRDAIDIIDKYDLGKFANNFGYSDFCQYPLYKFNLLEIEKYL